MDKLGSTYPAFPRSAAPEVAGIVRSVYKRHQRKLASGEAERTFAFIQSHRGKKSGQVRYGGSNQQRKPWAAMAH